MRSPHVRFQSEVYLRMSVHIRRGRIIHTYLNPINHLIFLCEHLEVVYSQSYQLYELMNMPLSGIEKILWIGLLKHMRDEELFSLAATVTKKTIDCSEMNKDGKNYKTKERKK